MVAFKTNFVSTEISPQSVIPIPWSLLCPPTSHSPIFFLLSCHFCLVSPPSLATLFYCLMSPFSFHDLDP